ncbi:MAG: TonB family protein [Candidatus Rokubacteria bacterium]|nr:TonB family protein [Candidatus Rokubacteria bacterium]
MAYRVPRRFIVPPNEPPPYGLLLLSFLGHAFFLLMTAALSAYVNAQAHQSKIYIVNLVPPATPMGSPTPRVVEAPPKVPVRTPPKPEKTEAPRPKEPPPPKREKAPEKADLPPPKREKPAEPVARPTELALPRKVEKETPALDRPGTRERLERLIERTPPPPATPPPPPRVPEPSRVTPPQAPPPALPAVAAVRPGVEPMRLGRPDATVPTTGSISLDVSDFPFTYYLRQIQAKISERWAPPRAAVAGGEKVVVLFEIGRDGQIKEPSIERSSGNAIYDQSALRAVVDASPFPPLPRDFAHPSLKVHFGFEFKLEQG